MLNKNNKFNLRYEKVCKFHKLSSIPESIARRETIQTILALASATGSDLAGATVLAARTGEESERRRLWEQEVDRCRWCIVSDRNRRIGGERRG
ncbi:hypothetical protein U1Q18_032977 [Sarracenia purpurea var. burkii]